MVKLHATSAPPTDNMRNILNKVHLTKHPILPIKLSQEIYIYIYISHKNRYHHLPFSGIH